MGTKKRTSKRLAKREAPSPPPVVSSEKNGSSYKESKNPPQKAGESESSPAMATKKRNAKQLPKRKPRRSPPPMNSLRSEDEENPTPASKNPPQSSGDEDEAAEHTRAPPPAATEKTQPGDDSGAESSESQKEEVPPSAKPAPKQDTKEKGLASGAAKKQPTPSRRIWSTEDELRILDALVAHYRAKGELPQPNALFDDLAGKLDNRQCGSAHKLNVKVLSMKRKYEILSMRDKPPSNDHDSRILELAKIVWGGDKIAGNIASAAKKAGDIASTSGDRPKELLYPYLWDEMKELEAALPGPFKRSFEEMDDNKAPALDQKIKKVKLKQMKAQLQRADLIKEVTRVAIDLM